MATKVKASPFDSYLNLGRLRGKVFSKLITSDRSTNNSNTLAILDKTFAPKEDYITEILARDREYLALDFARKVKARRAFVDGWMQAMAEAIDKQRTSRQPSDSKTIKPYPNSNTKSPKMERISGDLFSFGSDLLTETSIQLARAGVDHTLVISASKKDALAELLALNPNDADGECGETDSEFGYYLKFVFKKGEFDKFLAKNANDIKSHHLTDTIEAAVNKANKEAELDKGFVAIVKMDEDDNISGEYYSINQGHQAWERIETAYEDEEEETEYDPETDDIEDDEDED